MCSLDGQPEYRRADGILRFVIYHITCGIPPLTSIDEGRKVIVFRVTAHIDKICTTAWYQALYCQRHCLRERLAVWSGTGHKPRHSAVQSAPREGKKRRPWF